MIGFRDHIFALYQEAFAAAMSLRASFVEAREAGYPARLNGSLRLAALELKQKVATFTAALPDGVHPANRLRSHLAWIDHWLEKDTPDKCFRDTYDLIVTDLPEQWDRFANWHTGASTVDVDFAAKVSPLLQQGAFDSALRKGWAVFKSEMEALFDTPHGEDGNNLIGLVFGKDGHTRDLLGGSTREAYGNLLRALTVLNRNEVTHNDIVVNPALAEAVLVIVGDAIGHVKQAASTAAQHTG